MSININSQPIQNNLAVEQNKLKKQKDARSVDSAKLPTSSKDSVQLTEQAMSLNKKTSNESQVNMKRVETLKAAILNGDYKINTERLAEKLSKFETDFNTAFTS